MQEKTTLPKILGVRLAIARNDLKLKQSDLVDILKNEPYNLNITVPTISSWETGRRGIPLKYNRVLAKALNVSLSYLLGSTDDKTDETDEKPADKLIPVKSIDLRDFDGLPLWIEFTTFEHPSAWALYNANTNTFMFKDGPLVIKRMQDIHIYTSVPDYEERSLLARKSLTYMQIMHSDKVYVIMQSPDSVIRERYNGWYIHNENKTALINPVSGLVLPYEGINISYRAYSVGDKFMPKSHL